MRHHAGRAALTAFLQAQRHSVLEIVEGLDDDRIRQVSVPSGWTPLGMVEHLAHAERFWFQQVLTGRAAALSWPPAGAGNDHEGPLRHRTPAGGGSFLLP